MIIWSGLGIFVGIIVIACEFAMFSLAEAIFHDPDYAQMHGWVMGVGLIIAAALCWIGGRHLAAGKTYIDPQTGQPVRVGGRHSLFFIPMHWWAPLILIAGFGLCTVNKTREEVQQSRQERQQRAAERQAAREARKANRP